MEIKEILKALIQDQEIPEDEIINQLKYSLEGKLTDNQISSLLTLISYKRLIESPTILTKSIELLRTLSTPLSANQNIKYSKSDIVDIVGTGGDGFNTFNVSTAASIIASACGCKVAKHGNRGSTSLSGSADFIENLLNLDLTNQTDPELCAQLGDNGYCFLFAPNYINLGKVKEVRKQLGFPTIFNFLGPLCNPLKPQRVVIGVYQRSMCLPIAKTLLELGVTNGMILNADIGLDEISPIGSTHIWHINNGNIEHMIVSPKDFSLAEHPISVVSGGDAIQNSKLFQQIIELKERPLNEELASLLDFIVLNTAPVLIVCDLASDFKLATQMALDAIFNGRTKDLVNKLKR